MYSIGGENAKLTTSVAALAVLAVLGAAAYFYFGARTPAAPPEINTGPDVGAEISGVVETPAEKLPETNPFKGYKNPFE